MLTRESSELRPELRQDDFDCRRAEAVDSSEVASGAAPKSVAQWTFTVTAEVLFLLRIRMSWRRLLAALFRRESLESLINLLLVLGDFILHRVEECQRGFEVEEVLRAPVADEVRRNFGRALRAAAVPQASKRGRVALPGHD